MTTNFYFGKPPKDDWVSAQDFIGKRSGAGAYCWECKVTLCIAGEEFIHTGHQKFYDKCPKCGQSPIREAIGEGSPAGVELGFSKPREARPFGVRGACSFLWHLPRAVVEKRIAAGEKVYDEYGRRVPDFLRMVATNCPIERNDPGDDWR